MLSARAEIPGNINFWPSPGGPVDHREQPQGWVWWLFFKKRILLLFQYERRLHMRDGISAPHAGVAFLLEWPSYVVNPNAQTTTQTEKEQK